jgi:hypothetical protein
MMHDGPHNPSQEPSSEASVIGIGTDLDPASYSARRLTRYAWLFIDYVLDQLTYCTVWGKEKE